MLLEQLFDEGLGHGSYLVADPDRGVAFVVDPDREVDRYLDAAARLHVRITHSLETHVHNDYVAGSAILTALRPITAVVGAEAHVAYPHRALEDGATLDVGALRVRAMATPGHTPEHVAYLVADLARDEDPFLLFSGGALLVGQIARVDLLGPDLAERLARDAYETLRTRVLALPDHLAVLPTHGGGSSCTSSGVSSWRWTTLGYERRHNEAVLAALRGFDAFRRAIAHGLPVAPAYYAHVRALNHAGAGSADRSPLPLLRDPLPPALVLIDPRPAHVFAAGHRRGAFNVVGSSSFAVRAGSVVDHDAPIVLLTTSDERADALRAQLALVGLDRVRGMAEPLPDTGDELGRVRLIDAREAARLADGGERLIDVREVDEWEAGHAPQARHIPYGLLERTLDDVPSAGETIVYCASGERSSLAASILERHGVAAASVRGGFDAWRAAGLPVAH